MVRWRRRSSRHRRGRLALHHDPRHPRDGVRPEQVVSEALRQCSKLRLRRETSHGATSAGLANEHDRTPLTKPTHAYTPVIQRHANNHYVRPRWLHQR